MQEQFNKIITYSQGIDNPKTDELFQEWEQNKARFINAFDGKYIISCGDVRFSLDDSEKERRIKAFLRQAEDKIPMHEWSNFSDFILLNADGFFDNKTVERFVTVDFCVEAGVKLVKAFKTFFKNNEVLRYVQDLASTFIQENAIQGELCFSVHPLDYLTLSTNAANWRSCHALDGDYRAGNLSYMADSTTVICYIREKEDKELPWCPPDFKWNSKKWRMLLYFNDANDMVFAGRQYPFASTSGLEIIRNHIKNIFYHSEPLLYCSRSEENWSRWKTNIINSLDGYELATNYLNVRGYIMEWDEVIKDNPYPLHYNDVLLSPHYKPPYMIYDDSLFGCWRPKPQIRVGSDVKCLKCGKWKITETDIMLCSSCASEEESKFVRCDICEGQMLREEMVIEEGGYIICPHCLEKYYVQCPHCGKYIYTGMMEEPYTSCVFCGKEM